MEPKYTPPVMHNRLREFLADNSAKRNGRDWTDLDTFIRQGLNVTNIGKAFGLKTWQAASDMVDEYYREGSGSDEWRAKYKVSYDNRMSRKR